MCKLLKYVKLTKLFLKRFSIQLLKKYYESSFRNTKLEKL